MLNLHFSIREKNENKCQTSKSNEKKILTQKFKENSFCSFNVQNVNVLER